MTINTPIATQFLEVQTKIAHASKQVLSGSDSMKKSKLIAVSKTFSQEHIAPAIAIGQRHFGENRIQEAQTKWPNIIKNTPDIQLHLIGPLQTNKVADALKLFDVIHTIDRIKLVQKIADAREKLDANTIRMKECLIQVNIGDESQKFGIPVNELSHLVAYVREAKLPLCGLMCIPPFDKDPTPYFALLKKLAREHQLLELSMGMSKDFECAIKLGATMVRVGSALFGRRDTS